MSRIRRILTVFTSLGAAANYTLQATVPPHTLSKCSAALPRPNWEPVLYYSITCVMGFLLFCILVAAYFEADRIFVADIIRRKVKNSITNQNPYDKSKVFDLKQVAAAHHNNNTPIQLQKKIPMQTKPPEIVQQPLREIAVNGHATRYADDKHFSDEKSFFATILSMAKSFLAPKPSNHSNKTPTKINMLNSQEADGKNSKIPDRNKPIVEPPISEKSIDQQKAKRAKAARRQTSVEDGIVSATHDRKLNKELNYNDKKFSKYDKNHHHDNNKSSSKTKPVTMTTENIETIERQRQPNYDGKFRSTTFYLSFHCVT